MVVNANDTSTVTSFTLSITNSGTVSGMEAAQLYIGFPSAADEPPKILRGFFKVLFIIIY